MIYFNLLNTCISMSLPSIVCFDIVRIFQRPVVPWVNIKSVERLTIMFSFAFYMFEHSYDFQNCSKNRLLNLIRALNHWNIPMILTVLDNSLKRLKFFGIFQ